MPQPHFACLHEIVREHAAVRPDATALVASGDAVSYADLDRAADVYAHALAAVGVGEGSLVPISLSRSPQLVAALLAVLKLGAAYALLDPAWPDSRIADVVGLLGAEILITGPEAGGETGGRTAGAGIELWRVPPESISRTAARWAEPLRGRGSAADACAVFFTSGTTGMPKGVVTSHSATTRLFESGDLVAAGGSTVMPLAAAVPWDAFSLELWGALLHGGTSVLVDDAYLAPDVLRRVIAEHGVNTIWVTSSLFNLLVDEGIDAFEGLGQVLTGGERLSVRHVRAFLDRHPGISLVNGYGPVESTVFTTTHQVVREDCARPHGIPIGRPVPRTGVSLLANGRPCAPGEPGEVFITGKGLALGYLGRPELTDERFVTIEVDGAPTRAYRSGDLAVTDEAGVLHYLGRIDRQVKIRGHRVEPAEVERRIEQLPGVRRCAIVVRRDPTGAAVGLLGFCLTTSGGMRGRPDPQLLEVARRTLPSYLVPDAVIPVGALPLTANGKLDERALLETYGGSMSEERSAEGDPVTPEDPLTAQVAEVFAEVLSRPRVLLDQSFRALGGSSLDAGRICARLGTMLARPVPTSWIMRYDTVTSLTAALREDIVGTAARASSPSDLPGTSLSSAQVSFLTQHLLAPQSPAGHCLLAWELVGPLDHSALAAALVDVARRHEALRARYLPGRVPFAQVVDAVEAVPLEHTAPAGNRADALSLLRSRLAKPLDLAAGRVWHGAVVPLVDGRTCYFGLAVHHIAFDGWSESVLAADLTIAYNTRRTGRSPVWDAVAGLCEVERIRAALRASADVDMQLDWWQQELSESPDLVLPGGAPDPAAAETIRQIDFVVPADQLATVDKLAQEHGTSRFTVLFTLHALALRQVSLQTDFAVGVPVAQRPDHRLHAVVGCHIDTLPIRVGRLEVDGPPPFSPAVFDTAARLTQGVLARQDVGFDDILRRLKPQRGLRAPIFQVLFVLQDNQRPVLNLDGLDIRFVRLPCVGIPAEMLTEVWTGGDDTRVRITHRTAAVPDSTADALGQALKGLLDEL